MGEVWEREGTEGAPSGTQGRCTNKHLDWEKVFIKNCTACHFAFYRYRYSEKI
jgi:hypothetical protein